MSGRVQDDRARRRFARAGELCESRRFGRTEWGWASLIFYWNAGLSCVPMIA